MDNRMHKIQNGNLSYIALEHFGNALRNKQSQLIQQAMVDYRTGMTDNKLIGFIASYTALEDLLNQLKRDVTNAQKLNKEVIEND